MSISKFFWFFLFAVIVISSIIRRDNNFWLFILLVSSGMLSIIAMGDWLKKDLRNEWKSLDEENARLNIKLGLEKGKEEYEARQHELVKEIGFLKTKTGDFKGQIDKLSEEKASLQKEIRFLKTKNRTFEAKQDELEKKIKNLQTEQNLFEEIPLKEICNYEIFFNEIEELEKRAQKSKSSIPLDTKTDKIISNVNIQIEDKYYREAFSEYFKKNPTKTKTIILNLYQPNAYLGKTGRRNKEWATKRSYEISNIK